MKIICRARRGGKTTEAVKLALKNKSILVVYSKAWASIIAKENPELRCVISFEEFLEGKVARGVNSDFIVEDVDMLLNRLAQRSGAKTIEAITLTGEEE